MSDGKGGEKAREGAPRRPKLSWRKKLGFAFVAYLLIGGLIQHLIYGFGPTFMHMGHASPKPYLPFGMTLGFHAHPVQRMLGIEPRITTNSLGYNDREFVADKPEGEIRIACLGGSTTFLPLEDPYPHQLDRMFEAHADELGDVEVWNASMMGYSVVQHEVQIRRELIDLGVDVVLVSEPWNYQRMSTFFPEWDEDPSWLARGVGKLPLYSQLSYLAIAGGFLAARESAEPPDIDLQVEGYMEKIRQIHALTEANGIELVLGLHPDAYTDEVLEHLGPSAAYDLDDGGVAVLWPRERVMFKRRALEAVRVYAREQGLVTVDWETEFRERGLGEDWFQETRAHVLEPDARVMAEIAYDALVPVVRGLRAEGADSDWSVDVGALEAPSNSSSSPLSRS